jgi:hypothetical protein
LVQQKSWNRFRWWRRDGADAGVELTPLHHRLPAVMAADLCRVFGRDEMAAEAWGPRPWSGGKSSATAGCSGFRRTVATVMYEHGVRARVIERIMDCAPRQIYERHYLRVADEQMRDAIRGLYARGPDPRPPATVAAAGRRPDDG